ncbi:transcriptional regulator GcvA (plasmid) [Tistrella bauzanensis]|uniref:Transcriptional regulator GcvA n=1 Tax=Tistrella arctica TaxID=3133430 RepID=A0ABU9YNL5_9PROT
MSFGNDLPSKRGLIPSLGALLAFEAAARHESFTRAAAELNLTQSAISRQIRQIEAQLGLALFVRVRQRVTLTDAGRLYLADVRRALGELGEATHRVMALAGRGRILNLATLPTFATRWLVPRLPDFFARHPDISINFATRLSPFDFAAEPFDAAIHFGGPDWPGARGHHLMREVIVPVASPVWRASHAAGLTHGRLAMADLARLPLLQQSTRPAAWPAWFAMHGIEAPEAMRGLVFEQFAMIAQAAASGLGAALLPRVLVEDELASGRLEVLFDRAVVSDQSYWIVIPDAKAGQPAVETFRDWVLQAAGGDG